MKRGTFKKKTYQELIERSRLRQRRAMKAVGKKGRESQKVVKEMKAECLKLGITSCELRISPYCTPLENLSFAHDRKRRHMGKWGSEERAMNMKRAIVCCLNCHDHVELMGEEKMQPIICAALGRRAA